MKVGQIIYDYALGMNGIIVGDTFTEEMSERGASHPMEWEWLVLYDDGDLQGADSNDLQVIE